MKKIYFFLTILLLLVGCSDFIGFGSGDDIYVYIENTLDESVWFKRESSNLKFLLFAPYEIKDKVQGKEGDLFYAEGSSSKVKYCSKKFTFDGDHWIIGKKKDDGITKD